MKKTREKIDRQVKQLDAAGQPLGRLATEIAILLRGKHKPTFQPHIDAGDIVEVINCAQIKFTGNKLASKEYIWHSNHPGGLKRKKVAEVFRDNPGEVLRRAVYGMLPKNKLREGMIKRLKIK
ncbi:MAG TPA: 50S ribosomal protein L13 [bacterium]|nr:50S ribosomal protein L13 [bacterium]HPN81114.1 50S ribosomal protein L13 [bacterium]HPW39132.1 50S ribosomal protein L13 [bacterium]